MLFAFFVAIICGFMFYLGKLQGVSATLKKANDDLNRTIEKCERFKKDKEK